MVKKNASGDDAPDFSFLGNDKPDASPFGFENAEPDAPDVPDFSTAASVRDEAKPTPPASSEPTPARTPAPRKSASSQPTPQKATPETLRANDRTDSSAAAARSVKSMVPEVSRPQPLNSRLDKPSTTSAAEIEQAIAAKGLRPGGSKLHSYLIGYAIALTAFLLFALFTGRLSLFGNSRLESLPDLKPLNSNEFQKIPDDAALPDGHVLRLGESRRFGDVVVKPVRVTRESLQFRGFLNGQPEDSMATKPVLKLWIEFESRATDYRFPPYDAMLMASRSPSEGTDETVAANSFLKVTSDGVDGADRRILNYLHSPDSNFIISDQDAGKLISPNETLTTFVACSEQILDVTDNAENNYVWRIQLRKGVNVESGNGVTTLVDVQFSQSDIAGSAANDEAAI